MKPDMNHGSGEKRGAAGRETFPADGPATGRALEPRTRALSLDARPLPCDGPPPRLAAPPPPVEPRGAAPALAAPLAQVFGLIPPIRRQNLEACARSTPFAGADLEASPQREELGAVSPSGRRGARHHWHTSGGHKTMAAEALALPAIGHARTTACARGKTSPPRPHTASESSPVPRHPRGCGLAWRPGGQGSASAAAPAARYFWRPIAGHGADPPSGRR
jgi:hypothetical protein